MRHRSARAINGDVVDVPECRDVERLLILMALRSFAPIDDENRAVHVVPHAAGDDRRAGKILIAAMRRGDLREGAVIGVPLRDIDARIGVAFQIAGVHAVDVDRVVGAR